MHFSYDHDSQSSSLDKTPTVLLVDDEALIRKLVGGILAKMGFSVVEAVDGREAWDWIGERQGRNVDLLLTDVVMPRMDGKALAQAVRRYYPDIKILISSAYADLTPGDLDGGSVFLPKPYSANQLRSAVASMLPAKAS